jgi:hypothetical protein
MENDDCKWSSTNIKRYPGTLLEIDESIKELQPLRRGPVRKRKIDSGSVGRKKLHPASRR